MNMIVTNKHVLLVAITLLALIAILNPAILGYALATVVLIGGVIVALPLMVVALGGMIAYYGACALFLLMLLIIFG